MIINFILHQNSSLMICSTRAKASQRIRNQPQTTRQYFQNTALQSPPRNPAPKCCHKPSKSLSRASKTTCQIFVANLVKTGTESPLISGGWKSLWHYVFFMFFTFRGPVLRTRFGRNHRHSFCWAYRCSVSRCSRFLAGFSVDAHTFAPGTILMPHGRKHDLPKPYERLPEASQKRDRRLPGGSKPTPNPKNDTSQTLHAKARPETSGRFQRVATSLPKASQRPPRRPPKPPQTRQNHPSNSCRECGQNWSRNPLKQSAGDSREPAAPPWGRQFVEWSVIVHLSTTRMSDQREICRMVQDRTRHGDPPLRFSSPSPPR